MTQSTNKNQIISDLIDEKLSSQDLDILVADCESQKTLFRYNTVSELLRDEYSAESNMSFVESVSKMIAQEPTVLAPDQNNAQTVLNSASAEVIPLFAKIKKATGGMAIAASVAVATFFSVQTIQVAQEGDLINSEVAVQSEPLNQVELSNASNEAASAWLETAEQKELELFNDMFMSKARQSEQAAIAPFARAVRGQGVGTIRFSKEQWENILRRSTRLNEEKQATEKQTDKKSQE